MKRLGLIAGNGKFPIMLAESAKNKDLEIIAVAFRGETSWRLETLVDKIYWIGVGQMNRLFDIFNEEDIKEAVMVGQIKHLNIFKPWIKKDAAMREFLRKVKDRRGDSLLKTVADKLQERGVTLLNSSFLLTQNLAQKGILTQKSPTSKDWEDINFGKSIAKRIAELGIGQTIVVKNKAILAVEAIEGTDKTIARGSRLGRKGCVVVKVSRPEHDMRYDIPVVGLKTLKLLKRHKVRVLAVEAGKTLLIDKDELIDGANKAGIPIVGI
jgi:UDP-2,3-diacylglucosamine hydrolase